MIARLATQLSVRQPIQKGVFNLLKYTLRKLLALIPKLLVILLICFLFMEMLPGDALSRTMDPMLYNELSEAQKVAKREEMGLNDPAPIRFVRWIGNVIRGEFGYSATTGEPVWEILKVTLKFSMELTAWALVLSTIIGIIAGFITAVFKNTVLDYAIGTVSIIGISLPDFFFGLMFIIIFVLKLNTGLPGNGRMPAGVMNPTFWDRLPYMVLPVACMTFGMVAGLQRYTRTTMLDVLNKDYIKTARSKGLNEVTVNVKHALRNSTTPVMTMLVMRIPRLVGGSVVIEQVFGYYGIGDRMLKATQAGDMNVALIGTCMTGALTLLASTLVDLVTALLDPRVRFE